MMVDFGFWILACFFCADSGENQGWLNEACAATTPASFAGRFTMLSPPYVRRGIFYANIHSPVRRGIFILLFFCRLKGGQFLLAGFGVLLPACAAVVLGGFLQPGFMLGEGCAGNGIG